MLYLLLEVVRVVSYEYSRAQEKKTMLGLLKRMRRGGEVLVEVEEV